MMKSLAALLALACVAMPAVAQETRVRDLNIDERRPRAPVEGAGVVVVSARGMVAGQVGGVTTFARLAEPAAGETAPTHPPARNLFTIASRTGRGENDSRLRRYRAYQIPPGRYVLSTFAPAYSATSHPGAQFCFGTVAFDIAAGDVVYVGDMVGTDKGLVIDFDLEHARSILAPLPALQTALKAASFTENFEFECNWADMARFELTASERARLIAAGALTAPPMVAAEASTEEAASPEAVAAGDASAVPPADDAPPATESAPPAESAPLSPGSPG